MSWLLYTWPVGFNKQQVIDDDFVLKEVIQRHLKRDQNTRCVGKLPSSTILDAVSANDANGRLSPALIIHPHRLNSSEMAPYDVRVVITGSLHGEDQFLCRRRTNFRCCQTLWPMPVM